MRSNRRLVLVAAAALAVLAAPAARASKPGAGTISDAQPAVTWQSDVKAPVAAVGCSGPSDSNCDNFKLTVVKPSYAYVVQISLNVTGADDWDLAVYDPAGKLVGTSGNPAGTKETVVLWNPAPGTYTVQAVDFAGVVPVFGSAILAHPPQDAAAPAPGPPPVFSIHTDPQGRGNGEPSVGLNWKSEIADNGGTLMYIAGLQTLRVRFDDCTSPPRLRDGGNWQDVSPPNAVASLDPILFTDPATGRTFSSQLSGTTSLMEFSDDDGDSWTPSQGGSLVSGVDHQTVGAGPFATSLLNPLYPHAVYYCSQDIALANCALSLNGGLTFGPAVPLYNLPTCGGLHGHVKVAPDGTAYVPNKSCGGGQAVVASSDNGITWQVRQVPGSLAGIWDPTVAVGAKGTLYFGYGNGDGRAMAAVSHDRGLTWSAPVDIGAPFKVLDTAFMTAVAGDDDRAAVAFLGSTTPGSNGDDPSSPAVWYLYVAMTYDGGATWTTVNATPGDPVQRGTICAGGTTGCPNGTRNLLDFMDLQVDRRGRPVVGFADGCTGACVTSGISSLGALATVARLRSGRGLFAAFDRPAGPPAEPLAAAQFQNDGVHLTWLSPDDNGRLIKAYRIYRTQDGQVPARVGTVSASTFTFVDHTFNPAKNPRYEVRAVNVYGESAAKSGCDTRVVPVGPPPPVNQCAEPGAIMVTDARGDETDQVPAHDILQISVAEPPEPGAGKVTFLLQVASLATVPPNTTWPINFKGADNGDYWVRMATDATGAVSFAYGAGTSAAPAAAAGTPADPASGFTADGTIRIVVPRSGIGNPRPGQVLSSFLTRVRIEAGPTGSALTPDNAPDSLAGAGNYRVIGNESCANATL
jgi:hypothetical protein